MYSDTEVRCERRNELTVSDFQINMKLFGVELEGVYVYEPNKIENLKKKVNDLGGWKGDKIKQFQMIKKDT